ncbi:beta-lactamase domain-containing protein [Neobacillus bataviensis LMG 21833]|uniref:Beta-lactamase domain-containing protein n=1 Tax=Neobacillus bataviensis LMG 21833 TaxID=1117379 RepID=K6CKH3_9BACI|nr:MBL fold metallo-hydrolase [Neobacillus bataviensis]EKN71650.1 beta-lactamase domain-containing protein [Neobacillus bataviensis LMG 21833]
MQKLQRISNRIVYLPPYQETDRPILAAVAGEERTLLIDAGNSSSHAQLFLAQLADLQIKGDFLVLTHWHWDHVFGMNDMPMPIFAFEKTQENVIDMQQLSWEDEFLDQRVKEGIEIPFCADAIKKELGNQREIILPAPAVTFDHRMTINLGGLTAIIEHVGGDHSDDSCVIYIPEEKVLFLGDCLYANLYSEKWNYTIEKTQRLIEQIETYDAETFFLSHHEAPMMKKEFQSMLNTLKNAANLTKQTKGDQAAITAEMSKDLQRELNEFEVETIQFFVNGYEG